MIDEKERFLNDEIFSLTLMATVGRAKVYRKGTTESQKEGFRRSLRQQLEAMAGRYVETVEEANHVKHITELATNLTAAHADALVSGKFRLGNAQKALNLYLKYLWCLGKIAEPPHCPFDYLIIKRIPRHSGPTWTALDDESDYLALVAAAKTVAGSMTLAKWEMTLYNDIRPSVNRDRLLPEHVLVATNRKVDGQRSSEERRSNHDRFAEALSAYRGQILSVPDIGDIVVKTFPDFKLGSLRPNDHGSGNKSCCVCAGTESRLFDPVYRGRYLVR